MLKHTSTTGHRDRQQGWWSQGGLERRVGSPGKETWSPGRATRKTTASPPKRLALWNSQGRAVLAEGIWCVVRHAGPEELMRS